MHTRAYLYAHHARAADQPQHKGSLRPTCSCVRPYGRLCLADAWCQCHSRIPNRLLGMVALQGGLQQALQRVVSQVRQARASVTQVWVGRRVRRLIQLQVLQGGAVYRRLGWLLLF